MAAPPLVRTHPLLHRLGGALAAAQTSKNGLGQPFGKGLDHLPVLGEEVKRICENTREGVSAQRIEGGGREGRTLLHAALFALDGAVGLVQLLAHTRARCVFLVALQKLGELLLDEMGVLNLLVGKRLELGHDERAVVCELVQLDAAPVLGQVNDGAVRDVMHHVQDTLGEVDLARERAIHLLVTLVGRMEPIETILGLEEDDGLSSRRVLNAAGACQLWWRRKKKEAHRPGLP